MRLSAELKVTPSSLILSSFIIIQNQQLIDQNDQQQQVEREEGFLSSWQMLVYERSQSNIIIIQKKMKSKNAGRKSSKASHMDSTSRHQLKQMEMSEYFQPTAFTLSNIKLKFFLAQMAKKIKFLSPPLRKPDKVTQQWQKNCDDVQANLKENSSQLFGKETLTQQLSNRFFYFKHLEILQGILILLFCWMVTVSFVFQVHMFQQLSFLLLAFTIFKMLMKAKIIYDDFGKDEETNTYEIDLLEDIVLPLMLLTAAIFMILREIIETGFGDYLIGIFEVICVFLHWRRIGKYFSYLTQYAQRNKMRKELRIIELFCFTIAMAHLFALIMYAMTYFCPEDSQTWIDKAKLTDKPWYIHYVYSYYWANTTMVTVGYGDLTPNNYIEAIVVTMIEAVGTAIFGYMINVIGITVNEIQKKNLEFQEHQATILKMREHYKLTRELCYKMKNDIKKKESESMETPLKNNEERQFLSYIDSNLKDQFVLETNMKVIKKSIFFLTHFSVNLQNEVALKLIRCIYKPEEMLSIEEDGERQLVIINNGKVNISYYQTFHNIEKSKVCREVKPEEGKPTLNVFGYSSLILNRNICLKGITAETVTAYILKRKDILESISKNVLDFESFNQLREKMQIVKRIEDIQAPSIKDIERHYLPNIFLLLKKVKHQKQERSILYRNTRKMKMKVITFKHYQNKTLLMIPHANNQQKQCESTYFLDLQEKDPYKNKSNKNQKEINIDQSKIFQNFLKNYNVNIIAIDYQKSCMRKSYIKRNRAISKRNSTKRMIKQ